ncbi:MAG: DNA cytosine methyltransferase [Ruminococcus flavefaciens]|nr:DNA cytosine methyltransferase [Ruminococcus flavefaciens]
MNNKLTLGSLFSGSGGFELAGILAGIEPKWSSEIEPFCIRVTTKRLPQVKHYGDISQINGADIELVDIITFGSPCTDVSIAGKREGLNAARSGLFFQAIRIIKEMRCATNGEYPKFGVFENVGGIFSSNSGEDFRKVLEEFCKIADESITVPRPDKWQKAGCIMGDHFSVAYRCLDAQYWGVPQRRLRLYAVIDFTGQRAGQILFESEGVSGYSAESFRAWQAASRSAENGSGASGTGLMFENHSQDTRYTGPIEVAQTVSASYGTGGNNQPFVVEKQAFGICSKHSNSMMSDNPNSGFYKADTARTIDTSNQSPCKNQGGMVVIEGNGSRPSHHGDGYKEADTMYTLNCTENHAVSYGIGRPAMNQGYKAKFSFQIEEEKSPTIVASGAGGVSHPKYSTSKSSHHTIAEKEKAGTLVASDYKDPPTVNDSTAEIEYIVRRLTPQECASLQGMPTWWCDGLETENPTDEEIDWWYDVFETHRKAIGKSTKPKSRKQVEKWLKNPYSDSAAYKMWGNGIAMPCAWFVLAGIVYFASIGANCERTDTKLSTEFT